MSFQTVNNTKGLWRFGLMVAILIAVVVLLSNTIVFIQPEEAGVVISFFAPDGYRKEPMPSGLHIIVPFLESVKRYSISRQTYTMSSVDSEGQVAGDDSIRARTRDGQEVLIDASVIYTIDPAKVIDLHINWQNRYEDKVVRPLARGIIRDIASQYGVEEIVSSKRTEMEGRITEEMAAKLADNELVLVDFILRDLHFSEQYAKAIEDKQIAEQQAQQAKLVIEQKKAEAEQVRQTAQGAADAAVIAAKGDAEARLIQAKAEAEALAMVAEVLKDNPDLLTYQYITKLAPNVTVIMVPSDMPFILPLPGTSGQSYIPN